MSELVGVERRRDSVCEREEREIKRERMRKRESR